MTTDRAAKLIIILGFNGTGKTTLVKKLVKNEMNKPTGRGLIVTPDDIEWNFLPDVNQRLNHHIKDYVKFRKIIYQPGALNWIAAYFRNGLLIFDDCRAYLGATTDQELHNLLIRRRQKSIDIIAVGHGFSEVPPKFFTFASEIILFKTMDAIKRRQNVIRNYTEMEAAQIRVNEAAQTNPYYFEVIPQIWTSKPKPTNPKHLQKHN